MDKERGSNRVSLKRSDNILHFSMQGSLPEGDLLALNTTLGTLSYLTMQDNLPTLIGQQQFTNNEMSVLLPLLDNHPYYCPYEVLYASFYNGSVNDKTIALSREQLDEAMATGIWDQQMRPIRNVLSRTRLKTRMMGIDILAILETGYILRFLGR
ncbi:MAG TPA: hypothetical protein DHW02_00535 [Ktedonobacter sp.]|nr:hypothetical protein [Ktedonobacter sp.]